MFAKRINLHIMSFDQVYKKAFFLVIALQFTLYLCIQIWSLDKGFDLDDEGCLMLLANNLWESEYFIFKFQSAPYHIFSFIPPTIINYRLFVLVTMLGSAFLFSYGAWKLNGKFFINDLYGTNTYQIKYVTFFFFIGAGVLSLFIFNYKALSYNTLNNALVQLISGLAFLYISKEKKRFWDVHIVSIGVLLVLQFFVKFLSLFTLGVFLLPILFIFSEGHILKRFRLISTNLAIGVSVGLLLVAISVPNFYAFASPYIEFFRAIIHKTEYSGTHNSSFIFQRYFNDLFILLGKFFKFLFFVYCLLGFIIFRKLNGTPNPKKFHIYSVLLLILFALECLWIGFHQLSVDESHAYNASKFYIYFLLLSMSCYLGYQKSRISVSKEAVLILFIFVLPFLSASGTSVSLIMHTLLNLAPWFFLALLYWQWLTTRKMFMFLIVHFTIFLFFTTSQFFDAVVLHAHRLPAGLTQQVNSIGRLPKGESLKIDDKSYLFFTQLYDSLTQKTEFRQGDYIIGCYSLGGCVYMVGGVSPGNNLYLSGYPSDDDMNCKALSSRKNYISEAFILKDRPLKKSLDSCLKNNGIDFNQNYIRVGLIDNPYSLTNPRDHERKLEIWCHKNKLKH